MKYVLLPDLLLRLGLVAEALESVPTGGRHEQAGVATQRRHTLALHAEDVNWNIPIASFLHYRWENLNVN
jgi:hypothetical protein